MFDHVAQPGIGGSTAVTHSIIRVTTLHAGLGERQGPAEPGRGLTGHMRRQENEAAVFSLGVIMKLQCASESCTKRLLTTVALKGHASVCSASVLLLAVFTRQNTFIFIGSGSMMINHRYVT